MRDAGDVPVVDDQEETGWKYIHGDVFRFPPHLSLFCACVGTGSQILTMAVCIFALALVGVFYPYNRGALLTACVVIHLQNRRRFCYASLPCQAILILKGSLSICGPPLAEETRISVSANADLRHARAKLIHGQY